MNYLLSREAEGDLVEIYDHSLDEWGEAQAEGYLERIYATFSSLVSRPLAGRLRPEIDVDVRSRLCGSHVVFYIARADRVDILRVLHQSRDFDSAFHEREL